MDLGLKGKGLSGNAVRALVWGGAACLLLLPLVAMQFTQEVQWTGGDFAVFGVMLLVVCVAYEVAARIARNNAFIVGVGVAAAACFLTVWVNLAVGIVGNENNPVNEVFFITPLVALSASLVALFRPRGMVWAMGAAAVSQLIVCVYVWLAGHGYVFVFTGVLCALWLTAARLFRESLRQTA